MIITLSPNLHIKKVKKTCHSTVSAFIIQPFIILVTSYKSKIKEAFGTNKTPEDKICNSISNDVASLSRDILVAKLKG